MKPKKGQPKADNNTNNDDEEEMGNIGGARNNNMNSPKGMPQTFQGRLSKIRTKSKG